MANLGKRGIAAVAALDVSPNPKERQPLSRPLLCDQRGPDSHVGRTCHRGPATHATQGRTRRLGPHPHHHGAHTFLALAPHHGTRTLYSASSLALGDCPHHLYPACTRHLHSSLATGSCTRYLLSAVVSGCPSLSTFTRLLHSPLALITCTRHLHPALAFGTCTRQLLWSLASGCLRLPQAQHFHSALALAPCTHHLHPTRHLISALALGTCSSTCTRHLHSALALGTCTQQLALGPSARPLRSALAYGISLRSQHHDQHTWTRSTTANIILVLAAPRSTYLHS